MAVAIVATVTVVVYSRPYSRVVDVRLVVSVDLVSLAVIGISSCSSSSCVSVDLAYTATTAV